MAQLSRRFGGHINWGENGPDNGTAIMFVIVFVLLMIIFAQLIVWFILTIYLLYKVKRNSRPSPFSPNLTQKQVQNRAALIVFTFGLVLLSKRFRAKQRRDFGPPKREPGEDSGLFEYTEPQMTMHGQGRFIQRVKALFGGKKDQEPETQVLSTGITNFEAVDAPQVQVEEPAT